MRNTLLILRWFHEAIDELQGDFGNLHLEQVTLIDVLRILSVVSAKIEAYEEELTKGEI